MRCSRCLRSGAPCARAGTGTTPSTRTKKAGSSGSCWPAVLRMPHLYDMHSSLPQQLTNFAFSRSAVMRRAFLAIERLMITRSRVVIVICPSLEETVRGIDPLARTVLIENAPGSSEEEATAGRRSCAANRSDWLGVRGWCSTPARSRRTRAWTCCSRRWRSCTTPARTRGWSSPGASRIKSTARASVPARRASSAVTIFAGERPADEIPAYLLAADVLVSPRSRGTNTPLKIYQYLRSGKPIVATRLLTHTQVLSDDTAVLTGATSAEFAGGILAALADRTRAAALGSQARLLAETKYSYEAYLERTRQACAALQGGSSGSGRWVAEIRSRHEGSGVTEGRPSTPRSRHSDPDEGRNHYSYSTYADPETARTFDASDSAVPSGISSPAPRRACSPTSSARSGTA